MHDVMGTMKKIISTMHLQKHYPINVSLFPHLVENCWENKIWFSENKNYEPRNIFVVETNLPTCFQMFSARLYTCAGNLLRLVQT